jgi:hypothetical protein
MSEETPIEEMNGAAPASVPPQRRKKEHFLGTILLVLIIFFILSSLVGIVFVGYTQWKHAKEVAARPTIETLTEEPKMEEAPAPAETVKEEPKEEAKTESGDFKKQKVAILNGGAVAGSAAKLAESLKKEGLESITTGSTEGDFTGTTIYYAESKKAAAESLLALVKKEYAAVEAKPADSTKKETSQEAITVILGEVK